MQKGAGRIRPNCAVSPLLSLIERATVLTRGLFRLLSEMAGLVIAGGLPDDHVPAVERVDQGDEADQRGQLIVVIVLGGVGPDVVGDTAGSVGDAGALLS